ncbi:MAG: nucleoside deaminase [Propionibacteriaceae bacterium]|nr:nucleoside deaminase [Propionibacteriaceae bacterium]
MTSRWDAAFDRALAEAYAASAHGDIPIGAVLLDPAGAVIAVGHNERELTGDPTAHAEVLALRRGADALALRRGASASPEWRLTGCTLVVTLEPCTMCAGALVQARIERVVFGAYDPKAGAIASLFDVVRDPRLNHRPEVVGGIRAAECARPLLEFFGRAPR